MTVNIGIFNREEDVVEAIRLLREAGMDGQGVRVVLKNAENAPLIASNAEVPIEDLAGIAEARRGDPGLAETLPLGLAGWPNGSPNTTASGGNAGGLVVGAWDLDGDEPHADRILREVGIPDAAAERCESEVEQGRFLLVAETEEDADAENLLRRAGAADVLH